MSTDAGDDNQIVVPPFFIALFVPPGRARPTESRECVFHAIPDTIPF